MMGRRGQGRKLLGSDGKLAAANTASRKGGLHLYYYAYTINLAVQNKARGHKKGCLWDEMEEGTNCTLVYDSRWRG